MIDDIPECARRLTWAGGTHEFNLATPMIQKIFAGVVTPLPLALLMKPEYSGPGCLEGQFGSTPSAALKRFQEGVYSVQDVECIIELGLVGGGDVTAADAVKLVDRHVRQQPLGPSAQLAFEVLAALFVGAVAKEAIN